MAAAEARAALRQTANRYFIQEDAKKAPKLSSYPSSSSSSKSRCDAPNGEPGAAVNGSDHPTTGCIPQNPSLNQLPNTKWWLHLQPNFGNEKDFLYEHLNSLEAELEHVSAGFVHAAKLSENHQPTGLCDTQNDTKNRANSFLDQPWKVSATCMGNEQDSRIPELRTILSNNAQMTPKDKDMGEFWYPDDHLMDLDPFKHKFSSDLESHWIEAEKNIPWWRTADKDELASLVAQKSLEHIENCDLPQPQTKHFRRVPSACLERCDHGGILSSSFDQMADRGLSSLANYTNGSPTSAGMDEKQSTLGDVGCSPHCSDKYFSRNNDYTTDKDHAETQNIPDNVPSRAQLLEALCHSQTRAREAEKAAQEAYNEKEHIIKLFLKQASQLFAYKQWFQLLQLENLCLQLRSKNQPISTLYPAVLPWVPYKHIQLKRGGNKAAKRKRGPPRYEISKCAVAFAVGLSLAGAGLLLGWTMGWLFPGF